jgi:hypothetical protein
VNAIPMIGKCRTLQSPYASVPYDVQQWEEKTVWAYEICFVNDWGAVAWMSIKESTNAPPDVVRGVQDAQATSS